MIQYIQKTIWAFLVSLSLGFLACSSTSTESQDNNIDSNTTAKIYTSQDLFSGEFGGTDSYLYKFKDSTIEKVNVDQNSNDWDFRLHRTKIFLNSGANGPGSVAGITLDEDSFTDFKKAPNQLQKDGFFELALNQKVDGEDLTWYNYNLNGKHKVTPKPGKLIAIRTQDGKYVKVRIQSYYKGQDQEQGASGYYTLSFSYISAPDNKKEDVQKPIANVLISHKSGHGPSAILDSLSLTVNYKGHGETVTAEDYTYFNLKDTSVVNSSEKGTTKWDIAFNGTKIILNGGSSGTGNAAGIVLPSSVHFDSIKVAPDTAVRLDGDSTKAITGWYDYDRTTHVVSPKDNHYLLVRTTNNKYVKIKFFSYGKVKSWITVGRKYAFKFGFITSPNNPQSDVTL